MNTPKRCLVLQLSTVGDIFQSLMALRAIKHLYPQLEITMVVRERFAEILRSVSWIQKTVALPTEKILTPILRREEPLSYGIRELANWIKPLVQNRWDFLVNWTYSEASSFLTALLPAQIKTGYSRNKDTSFTCSDGWSHFIKAIIQDDPLQERIHQNIHITDILTTQVLTALQIHLGEPENHGVSPVTSKDFFLSTFERKKEIPFIQNPLKRNIALHIGNGNPKNIAKNWGAENWAALCAYILKKHPEYQILLLGEQLDEPLASACLQALDELSKKTDRVINCVGKTNFHDWAALISHSQWLISGDTAALHLASVLGTRVLEVAVGTSRWAEHGPYGNGHYVIAPTPPCEACQNPKKVMEHSCSIVLSPEAVYATWAYASQDWIYRKHLDLKHFFEQLQWQSELEGIEVYRSSIRTPSAGGGIDYEPLISHSLSPSEWSAKFLGYLARNWFCGWTPPLTQELFREKLTPELLVDIRELESKSRNLEKICEESTQLAELLSKRCGQVKTPKLMEISTRDEIITLGNQLKKLDEELEQLGSAHPVLCAFGRFFKVLFHHIEGNSLFELSKESTECYRQLHQGSKLLREWIQFTLNLNKLKAVQHEAQIISIQNLD